MMSVTHCTIAAGTSLILGTASPLPLGLAIIGSQLPDLDTTTSTIGKIFFPLNSWIEDRFPHRSVTHCLLATAAITIVSISIGYFLGDIKTAIALYNQNASTHQVYANITGYWASGKRSYAVRLIAPLPMVSI
jgi:inner membrane protein